MRPWTCWRTSRDSPSMKVPPKRKGNGDAGAGDTYPWLALNESPSEKEGKYFLISHHHQSLRPLNESPSEKEGKSKAQIEEGVPKAVPSMKVPPKRKGNFGSTTPSGAVAAPLNESPSEKEGKCRIGVLMGCLLEALNESPSEKEGKSR